MDGMLGIFQSVVSGKRENISVFLNAFNEHQCLQQSSSGRAEFVSHLTGLLSSAATRHEGLLLLNEALMQCSLDILEQKGALWAGLCIKTCSQKNMFACVPMACQSLGTLIERSVDIPELSKSFSNNLLGNFFDSLKNTPASGHLAVLKCTEIGLRVYPGACGPHRGAIEKFVGSFVDCQDRDVVRAAATCLLLLQQIRGGSTIGISYQQAWQKLQLHILGSLHETLDHIFSDCTEFYDETHNFENLNIPAIELSDDPIVRASQLLNRYKNLMTYFLVILTQPFPVAKSIMPKHIMNFIRRGLAINCTILVKSPTSNNLAIGALLPEIHAELYVLLDTLILTLKSNMAPYVHTILSCVLETLKWTSSGKSTGFTKPFSRLRIAAYNTLSLWNKTMKYGSCCELIAEYVIEHIICDITPFQNEVTLKVLSGGKKHMSKKARRLLHKAQNEQSNISQTHSKAFNPQNTKIIYSDEGNQNLCASALNCLKFIIMAASCFLKPIIVKDILDTIFSIAIHVVNHRENPKTALYSNSMCRLNLCDVMYSSIADPHHLCPPPVQLVIDVFTSFQANDHSEQVRTACNLHLKAIEKIAHPQKESLYYPVDKNDIKIALRNRNSSRIVSLNAVSDTEEGAELETDANYGETSTRTTERPPISENIVLSSQEDDDEILPEIDLTQPPDENGHQSDKEQQDIQNISDTDEVIENISLKSSSSGKSSEIIEMPDEEEDPLIVDNRNQSIGRTEEKIDTGSEHIDDASDTPANKKRKTESDSILTSEEHVAVEDASDVKDSAENEDDVVKKCLADFVDEIKEN